MKAHFTLPEYDARKFNWGSPAANVGVCDASDLGIPAGKLPGERVWVDSCDAGFMIKGSRRTLMFILSHDNRHPTGEIWSWCFASEDGSFRVIIYND